MITPIPNQLIDAGQSVAIDVSAVDADGDAVTLELFSESNGFSLPSIISFVDNGDSTGRIDVGSTRQDGGNHSLTLVAADALGNASQWSFVVSVDSPNAPPIIHGIGDRLAVVGQPISIDVMTTDRDDETLDVAFGGLPDGAVTTDLGNGLTNIAWTPTPADVGTRTVTVTAADRGNGDPTQIETVQQSFDLSVRSDNQAPMLAGIANQTVAEGTPLTFTVSATDVDGDFVHYQLDAAASGLPDGYDFDPLTGTFDWTPNAFDGGVYPLIVLRASDGSATDQQTFSITVTNVNQPPRLVDLPPIIGAENSPLEFDLQAGDLDGDTLLYQVAAGTSLPQGMNLNSATGRVFWIPDFDDAGSYMLRFEASDAYGESDTVDVAVRILDTNRPPEVNIPDRVVVIDQNVAFTVDVSDPDVDDTQFSFFADALPENALLDPDTGAFSWTPGPQQLGETLIVFNVGDGTEVARVPMVINVVAEAINPTVAIDLTPSFPVRPGNRVVINPRAFGIADIVELQIESGGNMLPLDERGRAFLTPDTPGRVSVTATATDADGRVGTALAEIRVLDPADTESPVVSLDPIGTAGRIDSAVPIIGSADDVNLDEWTLKLVSFDGSEIELASGTSPVSGAIVDLDPRTFPDGFYEVVLFAKDMGRRESLARRTIEVQSVDKINRLNQTATDLSVDLGGYEFELTRQYDSLNSEAQSAFGTGWSLAGQTLRFEHRSITGNTHESVRQGDRFFVQLPDGQSAWFTFEPKSVLTTSNQGTVTARFYRPRWVADAGSDLALVTATSTLTKVGDQFFDATSGQAYAPLKRHADSAATESVFDLSVGDGTRYRVDVNRGVVELTTADGQRLLISDSGISLVGGDTLRLTRDGEGRILSAIAPDGRSVHYSYCDDGLLSTVQSTEGTTRYRYDSQQRLIAGLGESSGQVISYGAAVESRSISANLGATRLHTTQAFSGTLGADQSDLVAFVVPDSEIEQMPDGRFLLGLSIAPSVGSSLQVANPLPYLNEAGFSVISRRENADGSVDAIVSVESSGILLMEINSRGATAGDYDLRTFIVGDIAGNRIVDGADTRIIDEAQGTTTGDAGYLRAADVNRDGAVDTIDRQLAGLNLGFVANSEPSVAASSAFTHVDLSVDIDLIELIDESDLDPVSVAITATQNGMAVLSSDNGTLTFTPNPGFSGAASFDLTVADPWGPNSTTTFNINVSDAPLTSIEIVNRKPNVAIDEQIPMEFVGQFTDQADVVLPADFLDLQVVDSNVVQIVSGGLVGLTDGTTQLIASRDAFSAATSISVGTPNDAIDLQILEQGLDVYPTALTLAVGDTRNFLAGVDGSFQLSDSSVGTVFVSADSTMLDIDRDGLATALQTGTTWVTVLHGPDEYQVPVVIVPIQSGVVSVDAAGAVVQSTAEPRLRLGIPPGELDQVTSVSIAPLAVDQIESGPRIRSRTGDACGRRVSLGSGRRGVGCSGSIAGPRRRIRRTRHASRLLSSRSRGRRERTVGGRLDSSRGWNRRRRRHRSHRFATKRWSPHRRHVLQLRRRRRR